LSQILFHASILFRNVFILILKTIIGLICIYHYRTIHTCDISVAIKLAEGIINLVLDRHQIPNRAIVNDNLRKTRIAKQQFKMFIYHYFLTILLNLISSLSYLLSVYVFNEILVAHYLLAFSRCFYFTKNALNFFLHFYFNQLFYESFFKNSLFGRLLKRIL
jgi:hypothetical protein